MTLFVTGGAGFIGSAVIRRILATTDIKVVNIDKLTYAGNLESLASVATNPRYLFAQTDILDRSGLRQLFDRYQPTAVMHLAAESHVDRSIDAPATFIETNIVGTYSLLEEARAYWSKLEGAKRQEFRFHHVSTDEVFGSLGSTGYFTESTAYAPNSPYSASKAASDHLTRAWFHTYGFPVVTSNCSNNYGPFQFPEKLIPLMILNALEYKPLPVYGNGDNVRDWLFVEDHAEALLTILKCGKVGDTYNVGGNNEMKNLDVVKLLCEAVDELAPNLRGPRASLITFVKDRPGHDQRYAIDAAKISQELGWQPKENFASGLKKTVRWYIEQQSGWCRRVQDGSYRRERLGNIEDQR